MSSNDNIVAYVSPPRVQDFNVYPDYLHAFTLFLDFLHRHPEVGNEQTKKRVKQPSSSSLERLTADVRSRLKVAPESEDSEWEVPAPDHPTPVPRVEEPLTPATTVASVTLDQRMQALRSSPIAPTRAAVNPVALATGLPVTLVDAKGANLLGKKKVKTVLRQVCDEELATHLVAFDLVSRESGTFERQFDFLKRKSARHGGVLLGLDSAKSGAFTHVGSGRTPMPDYLAMWNSSEDSEG